MPENRPGWFLGAEGINKKEVTGIKRHQSAINQLGTPFIGQERRWIGIRRFLPQESALTSRQGT